MLPTTSYMLSTVKILPEVVEVSPTINEGQATPALVPPTEPGVQPTTLEPNIPPNVGSGRKGSSSSLYVGVIVGIIAFVIGAVVIVGLLVYRRRRSRVRSRRERTISEETKTSELMSPRTNSAYEPDQEDDTIRRSPMYAPNYGIPLWEDKSACKNSNEKDPIYAVIHFPEGKDAEGMNDQEPIYFVLEEPVTDDKETVKNNALEDPSLINFGQQSFENHTYAKVAKCKKLPDDDPVEISDVFYSEELSDHSDSEIDVLEFYVKDGEEFKQAGFTSEKRIYFTLEEFFSDTLKRTINNSECENAQDYKVLQGPDQYRAICSEALVYYMPKTADPNSSMDDNNNSKFTIEQVFDDLEERYLKRTGELATSSPGSPRISAEGCSDSVEKGNKDSAVTNEPVYNLLEEVCRYGPPQFKAISSQGGPFCFNLKRLKSNHTRATRIQPRYKEEEPVRNGQEEQTLKGPEDNGQPKEKPLYFSLKRISPDSLKQNRNDCKYRKDSNEPVDDVFEEPNLKEAEEPGTSSQESQRGADSSKEAEVISKASNESLYNFLEEVYRNGPLQHKAIANQNVPIYFTLKRLKSNHSKATRIQPRHTDEPIYSVIGDQYLQGSQEKDQGDEKPVYFSLKRLRSDSLKRNTDDSIGTSKPADDPFTERYLQNEEEPSASERPVFHNMERFYSTSFKKTNESQF